MFKLPDNIYNILKYACLIGLPATSTLIITIAKIWELDIPAQQIASTITALATALGAYLQISTTQYYADQSSDVQVSEETKMS